MHRSDLGDLTAFIAVADHLNFRAAASRLGITPSALSHAMRQLEDRLAVRLLNRTTRSMSLTDAGHRLLERLRPAIAQIDGALEDLNQERQRPFGKLRIYAGQVAIAAVIQPIWSQFLAAFPDVHMELQLGEAPIDIVAKGFDAGIGAHDRAAVDMVAVRVTGPVKLAAVAAPSYLGVRKKPRTPDDLVHHRCVQYRLGADGPVLEWPFVRDGQSQRIAVEGRVMVNNPELAIRAAVDGLGIALTIEALAEPFLRSGEVVRVLDEWSPCLEGLYLYYPSNRQMPAALRALIDMIRVNNGQMAALRSIENPFAAA